MREALLSHYIATEAMYLSCTACPTAVRSAREKFAVSTGVIFFIIWRTLENLVRKRKDW